MSSRVSEIEVEIVFSGQSQVVPALVEYDYQPKEAQSIYSPDIRAQVDIESITHDGRDISVLFNQEMRDALRIKLLEMNEKKPVDREIE